METDPLDDHALRELCEFDQDHLARREHLLRRLARETDRRREVRVLLQQGELWQTARERVPIAEMTPRHAANAAALLERKALDYALQAGELPDAPQTWMRLSPLYRALRRRANERPTVKDRVRDRRNRREYERGGR